MATNFDIGLVLGGFGLFMFGMKFMGEGLKSYSGSKMRDLIDKYTTNPLMGILIGCVVTCAIQSSAATSVIAIGFVRAGMMKLEQAFGILMGANIGTTVTAFLIGLKVEKYALYFCFAGGLILSLANRKKTIYVAQIIMGFGALFYGLKIMGDALAILATSPSFSKFTELTATKPILSFGGGLIVTMLLQSSSVAIGIMQKLYEAGGVSLLPAMLFVFAANIGTTITGILASIGGSVNSKRSAYINTLFNVIVVVFFTIILRPYMDFLSYLTKFLNLSPMMEIAFGHMLFNVTGVILLLPFISRLVKFIKFLVPGHDNGLADIKVKEIDHNLAATHPAMALEVTKKEIDLLKKLVIENVRQTRDYFRGGKINNELKEMITGKESLINDIDKAISNNLRIISKSQLTESDMSIYTVQAATIKNLERIGDIALNLMEFYEMVYDDKEKFSNFANEEVNEMYDIFDKMFEVVEKIFFENQYHLIGELAAYEDDLDILENRAQKGHFKRLGLDECQSNIAGSVYCDILSNLERMGDHCNNIGRDCVREHKLLNND